MRHKQIILRTARSKNSIQTDNTMHIYNHTHLFHRSERDNPPPHPPLSPSRLGYPPPPPLPSLFPAPVCRPCWCLEGKPGRLVCTETRPVGQKVVCQLGLLEFMRKVRITIGQAKSDSSYPVTGNRRRGYFMSCNRQQRVTSYPVTGNSGWLLNTLQQAIERSLPTL